MEKEHRSHACMCVCIYTREEYNCGTVEVAVSFTPNMPLPLPPVPGAGSFRAAEENSCFERQILVKIFHPLDWLCEWRRWDRLFADRHQPTKPRDRERERPKESHRKKERKTEREREKKKVSVERASFFLSLSLFLTWLMSPVARSPRIAAVRLRISQKRDVTVSNSNPTGRMNETTEEWTLRSGVCTE